jgi:hypothetical protein
MSVYGELKKAMPQASNAEPFAGSEVHFERFRKCANLHNISLESESASANEGATNFKSMVVGVIEEGNYTPSSSFNVDEMGLYWKKCLIELFISKEEKSMEGHEVAKDWLTLLLGGNVAGDFKLKYLLVYHSENHRALKEFEKLNLPVIWISNRKAWLTVTLFENWFTKYFCPAVKELLYSQSTTQQSTNHAR